MKKKFSIFLLFIGIVGGSYSFHQYRKSYEEQDVLTIYGNVDIRDVLLGFRVPGLVKTLNFEEGDQVDAKAALVEANGDFDTALANRDSTKAKLEAAKAQLEQAQISMNDTEMHSPDKGTILTRVREPGSVVAEGTTVYTLALDNPVWVRTYIGEQNLGMIHPGQKAVVLTDSGQEYQAKVAFVSPQAEFTPKNVETTQLRTSLVYRLRVVVDNPNNGLRQGMPVTVKIKK